MPIQKQILSYQLVSGVTKTFDVSEKYEEYFLVGGITLSGNITISSAGTPVDGMVYVFNYGGAVVASGNSLTIFSLVLTDKEMLAEYTITCTRVGGAWKVKLLLSSNNGANPAVDGNTIQAGTIASASMDSSGIALTEIAAGTRGGVITAGVSGVWEEVDLKTAGAILVGDGTDALAVLMSGGGTLTAAGVFALVDGSVSLSKLDFAIDSILSVRISLTAAEVGNINTAAKLLVAAPGSGFKIEVLEASLSLDYNSIAYTGTTDLRIGNTGASLAHMNCDIIGAAISQDGYFTRTDAVAGSTQILENTALILNAASDPSSGNSAIVVDVAYRVVTA